jgi:hypothetical protein
MRQQRTELAAIEAEIVIAASFTDAWPRSPRRPIECIPQRARFLCGHLHFTFATRNMPSGYLLGAQKHCTFGARNVARNRADANSRSDRRQVDRQNGPRSGPR